MTKEEARHSLARERKSNRWLLMAYDGTALLAVGAVIFGLHPSVAEGPNAGAAAAQLALAAVCFLFFRLLLRVYRQILRTGTVQAFARELAAGLCAGGAYLLINRAIKKPGTPFSVTLAFALSYILFSLLIRVLYYYLYRLALREGRWSQWLKKILTVLTLADLDSSDAGALMRVRLEHAQPQAAPINEVQRVAGQFAIRGEITAITQINKGYINRTYHIETLSDSGHVHQYTLQRINTNVFPDVDALMENFKLTTEHLHGRFLLPGHTKRGSVPMLRPAKDGRAYWRDDSGCWRMLTYFDHVYSLDIPDSPETFYSAGRAFGKFIREMADVELDDIREVIPNFHNTRSRYADLERAIAADPKNRVKDVDREIAFVRARADCYGMIADALASGAIPRRICHNDCNLNNILFDVDTHQPVAIIDLDTVMPSSPLYDYGDSMRIGTNTATDDEKDLSKVSCDLGLYEKYARGYLEECGSMLTRRELELLPISSLVITAEDGIRFLMDHINGDTYYNIYYPGQNLDRARTQLALLADMEKKLPQIVKILEGIYADLGLNARLDESDAAEQWRRKVA